MKLSFTLILMALCCCCFAQQVKIFHLKRHKFWTEQNSFSIDTVLNIQQEVCYNVPSIIDEELCMQLNFFIIDTVHAMNKDLDLSKDTSLVKCNFDISSVWNWEPESVLISGSIKLISKTATTIKIRLDVNVYDSKRSKRYIYKGTRIFKFRNKPYPE
jgi:hypothetical protein